MWKAGRMEGLLRDAARVRRQGPRRRLHARHRDAARRAGLERLRRAGRRSSRPTSAPAAPGRSTWCFPVTPQDGRAIPKPVASAAEGYTNVADEDCRCPISSCSTPRSWMRETDMSRAVPQAGRRDARGARRTGRAGLPHRRHARAGLSGGALRGGRRQRRLRLHLLQPAHGQGPQRRGAQGASARRWPPPCASALAPLLAQRPVGLTLQVDEGHEVFDAKLRQPAPAVRQQDNEHHSRPADHRRAGARAVRRAQVAHAAAPLLEAAPGHDASRTATRSSAPGWRWSWPTAACIKGRKIGLTSRAMQQSSQIDEPDFAPLMDDMFFAQGGDIPIRALHRAAHRGRAGLHPGQAAARARA